MMPAELLNPDLADTLDDLRAREEPYAIATIVRTAGATAAKPGAKALLRADGTILHGFLGGGCTKSAVAKAAQQALQDGNPQLISIAPEDVLETKGAQPGDTIDGVHMARNGCPSKGTIDVFIEPCLPKPELVIYGASPVALALANLAPTFDWDIVLLEPDAPHITTNRRRAIVIATQGQGDLVALKHALTTQSDHVAFVGSRRKYASLADKLASTDIAPALIQAVKAPAGLDIGAVTPEEIALSIMAQLTTVRRKSLAGLSA